MLHALTSSVQGAAAGGAPALSVLFVLLAVGEFGVSIPFVLQGVLVPVGYALGQGTAGRVPLLLLAGVLVLSRQAGSGCLYWGARTLRAPFIDRLERRSPRLRNGRLWIESRLKRRTSVAVAIGRLTPGLMVPTSLAAGATRTSYRQFALGVALSVLVWDGAFLTLGMLLGRGAKGWRLHPSWPQLVLVLGLLVGLGLAARRRIAQSRRVWSGEEV